METPESIGREAGKAIADSVMDAVEGIAMKLASAIAQTRAEQAELRDEVHALSNRIEALTRADRTARLNAMQSGTYKPGE